MSGLAAVAPWDLVATGYSEVSVEFFRGFSHAALDMLSPGAADRLLDVACGPGTLALEAAQRAAAVDALDFSENMIAILRQRAADAGLTNISPAVGDGQDLPYPDSTFDAAFSMFGLMFFPDRARGFLEIFRTLKQGGKACVSSWAPVGQSPLNRVMFGALQAIKPDIPDPKSDVDSLENPDRLAAELTEAGFDEVEIQKVTKGLAFSSAAQFWEKMARGSVPVLMMRRKLGEEAWREKSDIAVEHIDRSVGMFPAFLSADAWFGTATK